jgi:hypothetical protein
MMGPPDDATLDEWRAAFVRENKSRMALLAALDALVTEMRESYSQRKSDWADRLAAVIAAHRGSR